MLSISLQRLLLSLAVIVAVGGGVVASTGAFFNDTETSTGNTFAAGDIDLKIDNESFAYGFNIPDFDGQNPNLLAFNSATSWSLTDLEAGVQHFFDFTDLKPGDLGEDTISIHVGSNDGYLCAAARVTVNSDETCTEPENGVIGGENGACVVETDGTNGDLAGQLNFAFWKDDGDNVFETGEVTPSTEIPSPTVDGTVFLGPGPLSGIGAQGQIALADNSQGAPFGTSVPGNSTIYIGKVWCFGTLSPTPVAQDGIGNTYGDIPGSGTNGPDERGSGWSCNGASLNNIAQTDKVQGDMEFYAVQTRNNPNFSCAQNYRPTWLPAV